MDALKLLELRRGESEPAVVLTRRKMSSSAARVTAVTVGDAIAATAQIAPATASTSQRAAGWVRGESFDPFYLSFRCVKC